MMGTASSNLMDRPAMSLHSEFYYKFLDKSHHITVSPMGLCTAFVLQEDRYGFSPLPIFFLSVWLRGNFNQGPDQGRVSTSTTPP